MKNFGLVGWIALLLVIVGALNIGFIGVFDFNVLAGIFGKVHALLRTIYVLIGLGGLYVLYHAVKGKK